jgi:hypothetical protein
MSVPVDLDQLAAALADFTFAYLITVGDDHRAHAVAVEPVLVDGAFEVGAVGRSTRRNAGAHADVTLVWPPAGPGGYSLIVDGRGSCASDDAPVVIVPGRAVLHRKATADSPPSRTGCADDCVPLEKG